MSSSNTHRSLCCCGTQWGAGILVTLMSSCMSVGTHDTLHYWDGAGLQLIDVLSGIQYGKGSFRSTGKKMGHLKCPSHIQHPHALDSTVIKWLNQMQDLSYLHKCSQTTVKKILHVLFLNNFLLNFVPFQRKFSTRDPISRSEDIDLSWICVLSIIHQKSKGL